MRRSAPELLDLLRENEELRAKLAQAEDTVRAIRAGEIEVLAVQSGGGPPILTLEGADRASNSFHAEMLAQVNDPVLAIDNEGRITFLNAAAEHFYGVRSEGALGRRIKTVCETRWLSPGDAALRTAALRETGRWRGENIHVVSGREIPVESSISVLRDVGGKPVGLLSVVRDITERKRGEVQLRRVHQRLQSVLRSISDGLLVLDTGWRFTYSNEQGARMLGATVESLLGRRLWEAFPAPGGTRFQEYCRESVRSGQSAHFVEFYPKPLERWFECHCYPSKEGLSVYFHDITGRKAAEEEITKNHALLDTLLSHAPVGFAFLDRHLRFVRVNQRLAETNGLPIEAHIGRSIREIVPSLAEAARALTERIVEGGQAIKDHEFCGETPLAPGIRRFWNESWYPVRDAAADIIGFGVVVEEITEQKRRKQLLLAQKETFELAVSGASPQAVLGKLVQSAREYFHESRTALFSVDDAAGCLRFAASAGMPGSYTSAIDGHPIGEGLPACGSVAFHGRASIAADIREDPLWAPIRALAEAHEVRGCWSIPVRACEGKVLGTLAIYFHGPRAPQDHELEAAHLFTNTAAILLERDKSARERNAAQEALRRFNAQLEERVSARTAELQAAHDALEEQIGARRRLEQEVLEISEREQSRLGQDLHDDLGQQLAGIGLLAQVLHSQLAADAHPRSAQIEQIKTFCQHALSTTRSLAKSFYPVELERHGLRIALEDVANRAELLAGVQCEVRFDEEFRAEKDAGIHLYRIVQESISNAIRHGRARRILIEALARESNMALVVSNDGLAYCAPEKGAATGIGLDIFQYRARLIGAQVNVRRISEMEGCRVTCVWPRARDAKLAACRTLGPPPNPAPPPAA